MSITSSKLEEFHKLLDEVIELQEERRDIVEKAETLQTNSRDLFTQAIQILRETGMSDFEISELTREYLRNRIPKSSLIKYLAELKPEIEQSTSQSDHGSDTTEECSTEPKEETSQSAQTIENLPPAESNEEEEEEPSELELAQIKIQQLQDALKKTEQFKAAFEVKPQDVYRDEHYFKWLADKANGVQFFYYDSYGIDLFKTRELSQLKNQGVKVFKRLYFEV